MQTNCERFDRKSKKILKIKLKFLICIFYLWIKHIYEYKMNLLKCAEVFYIVLIDN